MYVVTPSAQGRIKTGNRQTTENRCTFYMASHINTVHVYYTQRVYDCNMYTPGPIYKLYRRYFHFLFGFFNHLAI